MRRWQVLLLVIISAPAWGFDHRHQQWSQLLEQAVHWNTNQTESAVDYTLMGQQQALLNRYLAALSDVSRQTFDGWSREQQLAFLINAYNGFTIKLVLSRYPDLNSVKDLGGFFSSAWERQFFSLFGEERNLDFIEHQLLRQGYQEPRIHFALNRAARGCPPLLPQAYTEENLEPLLEENIKRFLSNRSENFYDTSGRTLFVSKLFDWYQEDFQVPPYGSVLGFLAQYQASLGDNPAMIRRLEQGRLRLSYLGYDWSLNRWPFPSGQE